MKRTLIVMPIILALLMCGILSAHATQNVADLVAMQITYTNGSVEPGDTVYFDTGITNAGTADTEGFNIKWFVNGEQTGYGYHSGIPAGTTMMNGNSQFIWTPEAAGVFTIYFMIDADDYIAESNEYNNIAQIEVWVGGQSTESAAAYTAVNAYGSQAASRDLAALDITFDGEEIVAGSPVLFKAGVMNIGAIDAQDFNVMWKVDEVQAENGYGAHSGVPAYATVTDDTGDQYQLTPETGGTYTISFTADADQFYAESNENNNTSQITVEVADQPAIPWPVETFVAYRLDPKLLRRRSALWHTWGRRAITPKPTPISPIKWRASKVCLSRDPIYLLI